MDVTSDDSIDAAASALKEKWSEGFDGFVHSIAWAPRECIEGSFLEGISREGFLQAMNVSVYSYAALAKAFSPLLRERASIITMSYLGAEKIVPNLEKEVSGPTAFHADQLKLWQPAVLKISDF